MHYASGNEAKVGDLVVTVDVNAQPKIIGEVVSISPGISSCNAQVLPFARRFGDRSWTPMVPTYCDCVTLSQMERLDVAKPIIPAKPV